jgi:hypothetical protein
MPFIYRLKLYALFINGKNETVLYRDICYIEVFFKAGLSVVILNKKTVIIYIYKHTVRPAHVVTFIKQLLVIKYHIFPVLS